MPAVMAVRRSEFQALVRGVPFVALPREEIDRLYAAIEVLAVNEEMLQDDAELIALHIDVAIHHNYSWLTFRRDQERMLLLSAALTADGPAPLFLGESFVAAACRLVEERLGLDAGCDVRIAGILQETTNAPLRRIGLLTIARLTQRQQGYGAEYCGNGELRLARSEFDASSQVVIDHLAAF